MTSTKLIGHYFSDYKKKDNPIFLNIMNNNSTFYKNQFRYYLETYEEINVPSTNSNTWSNVNTLLNL